MSSIKTSPTKKTSESTTKQDTPNDQTNIENFDEEPSMLSDPEDYLEENETLDMNLSKGDQKVWLVKLPKYLMDDWSNPDSMNGQQLGNVKIKKDARGKLQVKLLLDNKNDRIPKEYDIKMLNTQVRNSYVFTEENLKKFKQEVTEVSDMPEQPQLKELNPEKKKFQKYIPFVKTIPKKTSLMGKVCHDCTVVPARTGSKHGESLMKHQNMTQGKERPKVTLLNEIPGVIQSNAGPSIKGNAASIFLKSTQGKNKSEGRAIRMPKKDLLDLLFRLFEEYEYWSMKGLKERTRQPESYLKESLESIATLIKRGPYTSKYTLKAEYRRLRDAERAVRLGLDEDDQNKENNEDEDEDEEMEDVV
ncbi:Transcription initiation factor IIF, beta subunit family protein [Candida albicans]|uniref:Transcription initiation factor IIF subunit beta n=1 Tax=Candida albicans TaxID=5476 RepID=A0A8H6F2J4_CANAX|nr:Transcription initiation factor IIF, beta subunit family protein [Candida albicans]